MADNTAPSKPCRKCALTRPLTEFHRNRTTRDGRQTICKPCRSVASAEAKEARSVYARAWYEANRDRTKERSRAWHAANRERANERARAYYINNRERILENVQRWAAENPEKMAELYYRRRVRDREARVGVVDLAALWTGACALCSEPMSLDVAWPDPMSKSVDHVIPLAKGGTHEQSNLQWAHLMCNKRKGARLPKSA